MSRPGAPRPRRRLLLLPAAALAAATVVPVDVGIERELWSSIGDAFHAPLMATAALLVWLALPARWDGARRAAGAALISVVLALAIEIGQPWVGRSASLTDAVNGVLGIGVAIGGLVAWRCGGPLARAAHVLACVIVLVVVSIPAATEWRAIRWRERHRPLLGDFEHPLEGRLWKPVGAAHGTQVRLADGPATSGDRALELVTAPGGWSGVSYHAARDDWSGGRQLALDVMNLEQRDVVLHVRVDDDDPEATYHDRFNAEVVLAPGWNALAFPLARVRDAPRDGPLDLTRIRRLVLFVAPGAPAARLRVDHVRID